MKLFNAILFCFLISISSLYAQNSKKRSELERLKQATQEIIEETSRMLSNTNQSALSSLNELNLLSKEVTNRRQLINTLNAEIIEIEKEQNKTTKEISVLEKNIGEKKIKYGQAMRKIYSKRSGIDEIMFVFSAESLAQSYRRMRYLQEYSGWRKTQVKEIVNKQQELSDKITFLEQKKEEKSSLLEDRKNETEKLREKENEQKLLVSSLQKRQRSLQSELKQQQAESRKIERKIEILIEEEARKALAEAEASEKANASSSNKKSDTTNEARKDTPINVDPTLSGSFEKNKGKLPFPVNGSYVITGRFGPQKHPQLKLVETNYSWIELQTKPGAQARAVFDGVVTKVFLAPGNNTFVIVRHGKYFSVYGNLSEVYVKSGDNVKTKQSIGKIFSDSQNNNITKMQFQIWNGTTKLNPELWLAK
ncbi:MAG: peptidoglycan DD-metalloendopeptidase family protein [Bacteroidales bacterium]|nr:peptidoglycan DD-metalloendopeptidase family protein [Bacteroidales bacterium]